MGLRFRPVGLRFRPVGLRFRPVGLRFRPVGLRFRLPGPRFSRPQSTASHLFARTRSFHRPTYKRPAVTFVARSADDVKLIYALCTR